MYVRSLELHTGTVWSMKQTGDILITGSHDNTVCNDYHNYNYAFLTQTLSTSICLHMFVSFYLSRPFYGILGNVDTCVISEATLVQYLQ